MIKELIISLLIIIFIFIGNTITDKYTKNSIEEISKGLTELREELMKEENEINFDIAKQKDRKSVV